MTSGAKPSPKERDVNVKKILAVFVFLAWGSFLPAQTLVEKLLGNQDERQIGYAEDYRHVPIRGVVIKLVDHDDAQGIPVSQVELVIIGSQQRTLYRADAKTGAVLSYSPPFDNCNPGFRVVKYELHPSVAGMSERTGTMSWHCAVRLKVLVKPVGSGTNLGRRIQAGFDALVEKYRLDSSIVPVGLSVRPAPMPKRAAINLHEDWAWWVIFCTALPTFIVGRYVPWVHLCAWWRCFLWCGFHSAGALRCQWGHTLQRVLGTR